LSDKNIKDKESLPGSSNFDNKANILNKTGNSTNISIDKNMTGKQVDRKPVVTIAQDVMQRYKM
jgi:hypothetical protein